MTRSEALARLRAQIAAGKPIIGAGAGTGLSAKCAEAGGIDLIIIYNSGRFRMAGRGSLVGHAALRRRQRDRHRHGPRGAAGRGGDAGARRRLRHRSVPADEGVPRRAAGGSASAACRTSRPSACSTATFRQNLEETGMGYGLEVDMIRLRATSWTC